MRVRVLCVTPPGGDGRRRCYGCGRPEAACERGNRCYGVVWSGGERPPGSRRGRNRRGARRGYKQWLRDSDGEEQA